jgi:ATP-dependent DNA helicase RecQ
VANPKLDPLIKSLLRLYGGELFSNYLPINEKELAILLKTEPGQIRKWLQFLHYQKVLDYQASSDSQQITFLTPRQDANNLPIDHAQIAWRKKLAVNKAKAVIDLERRKKAGTPSFADFNQALTEPKKLSDLKILFPQYKEVRIVETLRLMMEDGRVVENDDRFSLTNKSKG